MAQKAKIKKKRWYPIVAPRIFRETVLGETLLADPEAMVGKTLTQNLMNLTGEVKRQQVNIKFLVTRVQNNKGIAEVVGYSLMPASVRRLMRRRSEKMDMSFVCYTLDNKRVRIKPLIVTKTLARSSVVASLRRLTVETLTRAIKKMSYDNLINDLVLHKLQRSLNDRLKKVFPLKICEIRYMQIEKERKPGEEGGAEFAEEEPKEEAESGQEEKEQVEEKEDTQEEPKEEEATKEKKQSSEVEETEE